MRSRLNGNAEATSLVDEVEDEVQHALGELRELARGIHPAVLSDQGLTAAIRTLAERAAASRRGRAVRASGFPAHVETAVYFLVAEALDERREACPRVPCVGHGRAPERRRVVEVRDDGVGGAALDGEGSGLRGLVDRVGALDGTLVVDSAPGHGTRLIAEIPCGS